MSQNSKDKSAIRTYSKVTRAIHAGVDDDAHGAIMPPVYLTSNFSFEGPGRPRPYDYSRSGNPTRTVLADTLSALEGGDGCVVTASGIGAIDLPLNLLGADDLLIAPHDCYGGTYRLLEAKAKAGRFKLLWVDQTDDKALNEALAQNPAMVMVETPSNPLLRISDIESISDRAHEKGALVVVDNTFMTPLRQNPLTLGADIVCHSTTKYINGHSDVIGGAVIAGDKDLHRQLAFWANCTGTTAPPFDCFLAMRGLRTLDVRLSRQEENTAAVAAFLKDHNNVTRVNYPGFESHKGHDIAVRQQSGFGAMLSFEIAAGPSGGVDAARRFIAALDLFSLAASLGGVESLVAHPATMSHATMDKDTRAAIGIKNTLIRLSVGIEDQADLIAVLDHALTRSQQAAA